jgi:hypothetical protein
MYACIPEIGRGFFQGVRAPSNATAHSYDQPRNANEPEPRYWDSGPKWITHRATVDGTLAWGTPLPRRSVNRARRRPGLLEAPAFFFDVLCKEGHHAEFTYHG